MPLTVLIVNIEANKQRRAQIKFLGGMMSLEDLGLSEEQLAGVNAYTEGLKNNSAKLLDEKKSAQSALSEAQETLTAKDTALQLAEEQRLKLAGDMDGLKSHYEKANAESIALANEQAEIAQNALNARDKSESKQVILNEVKADLRPFADAMLNESMLISRNEKGELVKEFKVDGGTVGTEQEFLSWASEHSKAWQQVLVVANSSGAGTLQSTNNSAITKSYSEMSLKEQVAYNSK